MTEHIGQGGEDFKKKDSFTHDYQQEVSGEAVYDFDSPAETVEEAVTTSTEDLLQTQVDQGQLVEINSGVEGVKAYESPSGTVHMSGEDLRLFREALKQEVGASEKEAEAEQALDAQVQEGSLKEVDSGVAGVRAFESESGTLHMTPGNQEKFKDALDKERQSRTELEQGVAEGRLHKMPSGLPGIYTYVSESGTHYMTPQDRKKIQASLQESVR